MVLVGNNLRESVIVGIVIHMTWLFIWHNNKHRHWHWHGVVVVVVVVVCLPVF